MKPKYIIWFAGTLILGVAVWWVITPSLTVEQANQLVTKEVPQGASVSQVGAFLDSHKIEHSEVLDLEMFETATDFRENPKLDGKRERIKGMIQSIIRDVEWGFLVSWSISIKFYFDEQGRLVEYTVTKVGTGL